MNSNKIIHPYNYLVMYLPTVVTTLYLLAAWYSSEQLLSDVDTATMNMIWKGNPSATSLMLELVDWPAPFIISSVGIAILLVIYFTQVIGLYVSVLWLIFAFFLSWLMLDTSIYAMYLYTNLMTEVTDKFY